MLRFKTYTACCSCGRCGQSQENAPLYLRTSVSCIFHTLDNTICNSILFIQYVAQSSGNAYWRLQYTRPWGSNTYWLPDQYHSLLLLQYVLSKVWYICRPYQSVLIKHYINQSVVWRQIWANKDSLLYLIRTFHVCRLNDIGIATEQHTRKLKIQPIERW